MQFFRQFLPQGLVAGLSQQGEHILLIRLHPRLVEGIHVQQVAGQAAGVLEEVDELTQREGIDLAGAEDDVGDAALHMGQQCRPWPACG